MTQDLVLLEHHEAELRRVLHTASGAEAAAYVKFGRATIAADPWTGATRTRFVSHTVVPVPDEDQISASPLHVTWLTRGFVRHLARSTQEGLVLGIAHSHPGGHAIFSPQDDRNERELARAVHNRNGPGHALISVLVAGDGLAARAWTNEEASTIRRITVSGRRLRFFGRLGDERRPAEVLERQGRLFGHEVNDTLRDMRVAVVGCGGTGSPVVMLLLRLGVGQLLLIDTDVVEVTNLNRIHGSRRSDIGTAKVDVLAREVRGADLGVNVATLRAWAGAPEARDALKACDMIFGCTDDHDGRALLSRLAYFYGIPLIDIGLRMVPAQGTTPYSITARLSVVIPGAACLLCRNVIDPARAAEEHLERTNPDQFRRLKAEAYVQGSGDSAPAVVTFTTEAACMAVNELLQAITGFRGADGMSLARFRRLEVPEERTVSIRPRAGCQVCDVSDFWGRGDVEPFLYRAG